MDQNLWLFIPWSRKVVTWLSIEGRGNKIVLIQKRRGPYSKEKTKLLEAQKKEGRVKADGSVEIKNGLDLWKKSGQRTFSYRIRQGRLEQY